jgi:hypothetical protein
VSSAEPPTSAFGRVLLSQRPVMAQRRRWQRMAMPNIDAYSRRSPEDIELLICPGCRCGLTGGVLWALRGHVAGAAPCAARCQREPGIGPLMPSLRLSLVQPSYAMSSSSVPPQKHFHQRRSWHAPVRAAPASKQAGDPVAYPPPPASSPSIQHKYGPITDRTLWVRRSLPTPPPLCKNVTPWQLLRHICRVGPVFWSRAVDVAVFGSLAFAQ